MPWFKLDDQIGSHPKTIAAKNEAFGAWARMGAHASAYLTDGFISVDVAMHIAERQEVVDRLVAVGFLDIVDGGYNVHDYLDWNPPAEKVRAEREAEKARKAAGRSKQGRDPKTGRVVSGDCPPGIRPESARTFPGHPAESARNPELVRPESEICPPVPSPSPSQREERETAQPTAAPTPALGAPPQEGEWGDVGERHAPTQADLIRDAEVPGEAQMLVGLAANADMLEKVPLQALAKRMAIRARVLPESVDRASIAHDCCAYARGWAGKANKKTTAKQRAACVERKLGWVVDERHPEPTAAPSNASAPVVRAGNLDRAARY